MPLRMIDWQCQGKCRRRWEELTSVTAGGAALAPRCCAALARRLIGAPSIRTNDNGPRDMRVVSTAGHPLEGQTTYKDKVWDTQLGKETAGMSAREIQRYCKKRGIEIEPERAYTTTHLSYEPPPPRLEDNPALLRESEEDAADMYDRAAAGALPPLERPLLDEDAEGREAAVEIATEAAPVAVESAAVVEGA